MTDFVPVAATDVITLLTPGPVRWKSWMLDLSLTVIVNEPAFSVLTGLPLDVSAIVKPGPTVPTSLPGAAATAVVAVPATTATINNGVRARI